MIDSSPLSPVPEFSARQVVGADVLPGLRWMLAPAAVAGHRLASALRLLLRLLRPLHEHLGAVPEVRLPPRRPGPACSGVVRGRSTGAGHVRPRDAWAFNMAAYKSPLSQTSTSGNPLTHMARLTGTPAVDTVTSTTCIRGDGSERWGLRSARTASAPASPPIWGMRPASVSSARTANTSAL